MTGWHLGGERMWVNGYVRNHENLRQQQRENRSAYVAMIGALVRCVHWLNPRAFIIKNSHFDK